MASDRRLKSGDSLAGRADEPGPSVKPARIYRRRRYHDLQSALERLSRLETEREQILERYPDLRFETCQLPSGEVRRWQPRRLRRP